MKLSLITEEKIYFHDIYTNKKVMALLNPLPQTIMRELESIANRINKPHDAQLGGIITYNDIYVWDRYLADHESVSEGLKIHIDIGFYINVNNSVEINDKIYITAVDFIISGFTTPNISRDTLLSYPKIKDIIKYVDNRNEEIKNNQNMVRT